MFLNIIELIGDDESLVTLKRYLFGRPGIGPCPEDGHQHQSNRCHPRQNFCPLEIWRHAFRQSRIRHGQTQQQKRADQNGTGWGWHQRSLLSERNHPAQIPICASLP